MLRLLYLLILLTLTSFTTPTIGGEIEDLIHESLSHLTNNQHRDYHQDHPDYAASQLRKQRSDPCEMYTCQRADQEPVARDGFVALSNGCGSYGFKIESKWHESCCDVHDKCYSTCGVSRARCDSEFESCMKAKCRSSKANDAKECNSQTQMFYQGTRSLGCGAFKESQKEACDCRLKEAIRQINEKITAAKEKVEEKIAKVTEAMANGIKAEEWRTEEL